MRLLVGLMLFLAGQTQAWSDTTVIKPPLDHRLYQALTLDNHLRVLLISDPETDKAAVSLDVGVGYFDDPPDRPGLAHFLEHMLFLGTRKYPHPSDYRDFISAHGGRDNAYTMAEDTNFYFDIDSGYLEAALDHFSQFFIAPLFNKDYVAREVQAVDAEYRLKLRDDGRRLWQVQKATSNPRHPFAKFSVGNAQTLGTEDMQHLRQALINFYRKHYSANLMTLVVLGREPLETLRRWVERYFGAIPDRDVPRRRIHQPLFLDSQKQVWINVVPIKEIRRLRLSFPIPWRDEYYLSKPTLLIGHLLGHEGTGSLFQLLRKRGWADALRVGRDLVAGNEATLDLVIDLTDEGLRHVSAITALVFQALDLIRRQGLQPWIYEELRRVKELGFRYRETPPPLNEVRHLARALHHLPAAQVLHAPYAFTAYDRAFLKRLLARLRPGNLRLILMAADLPTSRIEPRYGTAYGITRLAPALVARWADLKAGSGLALPAPNPYIPDRIELKPSAEPAETPQLVLEQRGLHLWHLQDSTFRVPRATLSALLATPYVDDSPRHRVMTQLYTLLLRDQFDAQAYPASLAGLHYGLSVKRGALLLSLGGYNAQQPLFLEQLLNQMLNLETNPRRFEAMKAVLRRQWENLRHNRPYQRLNRELSLLLGHGTWPSSTYLQVLDDLDPEALAAFIPRLLGRLHIDVLCHGNLTPEEARALGRQLARRLQSSGAASTPPPLLATRLAGQGSYLRRLQTDHQDNAITVYYQGADDDPATKARILLLHRVLKGPFFYLLRSKDQLGYVVYAAPQEVQRRAGLKFVIQSPRLTPEALLNHIDDFLKRRLPPLLEALGEDEFDQYRQGLISNLLRQDHTLGERSQRFFQSLTLGDYSFRYRARLAAEVARIDKQTLLKFYRHWLLAGTQARLVLEAYGRDQAPQGEEPRRAPSMLIEDIETFRGHMPTIILQRM